MAKKQSKSRTSSSALTINEPEFWYDAFEAERPIEFIEGHIKYIEGDLVGEHVRLEDWMKDLLRQFFGWFKRNKKGKIVRKHRKLYLEIPRKNSKTTLTSWLLTFVLFCEGEQRGQVYCAAADTKQASIVFDMVKDIILDSPALSSRAKVGQFKIEIPFTRTIFRCLSAVANTKHGFNASCFVVDEVHEQRDRKLITVLNSSNKTRAQPIEIYITTAGTDRDSICWELHEHAEMVIKDPDFDPTFMAKIFGLGPDDDWKDPVNWLKVNPMLGIAINFDDFEADFKYAIAHPAAQNSFKRLYLNIWTDAKEVFIPYEIWMKNKLDYGEEALYGKKGFGGLDMSSRIDFTAFALAFHTPLNDGTDREAYQLLRYLFRPGARLAADGTRDGKPYEEWARKDRWLQFPNGLFEPTPGNMVDHRYVKKRIKELSEKFYIPEIACDRYMADAIITEIGEETEIQMVEFGQGFRSMTSPTKAFHALSYDGRLMHQGDPVMAWMLSCCELEISATADWKLVRDKKNARVDGVIASIMALGRAMVDFQTSYDDHYKSTGGIFG